MDGSKIKLPWFFRGFLLRSISINKKETYFKPSLRTKHADTRIKQELLINNLIFCDTQLCVKKYFEVISHRWGYFKTKLEPDMYSLFAKRGDLLYLSRFDEKNNIQPLEVKAGKWPM